MRNSMLKRVVGALLCTAILLASFSVYAFAAKEPQSTNRSSDTVSFGVQTVQFIESRTEITADGTQRRYGTLAFSFEVENASFEAPSADHFEKVAGWQYAVRNHSGLVQRSGKAEPQRHPSSRTAGSCSPLVCRTCTMCRL